MNVRSRLLNDLLNDRVLNNVSPKPVASVDDEGVTLLKTAER
jgi:hypothetical protein